MFRFQVLIPLPDGPLFDSLSFGRAAVWQRELGSASGKTTWRTQTERIGDKYAKNRPYYPQLLGERCTSTLEKIFPNIMSHDTVDGNKAALAAPSQMQNKILILCN